MGGPEPETPGARLLNKGMANSNKRAQGQPRAHRAVSAPNVLPRMKVCPVGCITGRDEAETKYQRARQGQGHSEWREERVLEKFSHDPWSSSDLFFCPLGRGS